jgi:hypothetical protein
VLYLGIIVGVSLIATPAKYLAPTLTLAELLDVGRQTFGVFAWVEYAFALALVLLAARGRTRAGVVGAALVAAVVLLQHLVLRPPLDARVTRIIAGETVEPSMLHHLYTAGTVAKLVLLVVVARAGRRDAVAAA